MRTRKTNLAVLVAGLSAALWLPACGGGSNNNIDGGALPDGMKVTTPDAMPDAAPDAAPDAMPDAPPPKPALSIDPSSQDFGSVVVTATSSASTFTITNGGNAAATGLATTFTGPFAASTDNCDGTDLAAGATCTIDVVFSPTATGDATGTLTVATSGGMTTVSANLTGKGIAAASLTITPTPHDFGDVVAGQTASGDFTVKNTGGSPTSALTASIGGGDATSFSISNDACTGNTLAAGATCTVTVTFAPNSAGAKATTLTVADSDNHTATASLSGTGQNPASLTVTPSTGSFGTVTIGNQSTASAFTVKNNGDVATSVLAAVISGTDNGQFSITAADSCSGQTLAAGAQCSVSVIFKPTSAGDKTASLDVSATTGGTASASLSGSAVTAGALSIAPTPQDFGSATVGDTGTTQTFTVTNSGGSTTGSITTEVVDSNASSFVIVAGQDNCNGQTLAAGANCTIDVQFKPQTAGSLSASLRVTANPGGSTEAALTGTGLTPAKFSASVAQHDFGSVGVGQPQSFSFTFTNVGDSTSGVPTVAIVTGDFNQYSETDDCTTALVSQATCTATVTFDPQSNGTKDAALQISASPGGSTQIALVGEGVDPAAITFQGGSSLDFGNMVVDYQSAESTLTVVNNGAVPTDTVSASLGGTNAADFTITSDGCSGAPLGAGASCQIGIEFTPQSANSSAGEAKSAEVDVSAGVGGSISGALAGTAFQKLSIDGNTADDDGSFGDVAQGNASTQNFTLTNRGEERTIAFSISGDSGFSITSEGCDDLLGGVQQAQWTTCTFAVTFTASGAPGAHSATLTATGTAVGAPGQNATQTLALSANVQGALSISAASNDFGSIEDGLSSNDFTFTITNSGGVANPLGNLTVSSPADSAFVVENDNCTGVSLDPPNASTCTFDVKFSPTAPAGDHSGTVTVTAANDSGVTVSADLSGTGLTPGSLQISGTADFGDVIITDSSTETYTVTNPGQVAVQNLADGLESDPGFSIVTDPTQSTCLPIISGADTLAPGASCQLVVEFAPAAGSAPGGRGAGLGVSGTDADAGTNVSASLELSANALSQLTIDPTSNTFPATVENQTSPTADFTVTNVGTQIVTGISSSVASGDTADFAITTNGCSSLAAGASCTLSVAFTPTTNGSFAATLTSGSNQGATASAALSGTGLVQPTLTANPPFFFFGGVVAGSVSDTQPITFTNSGQATTGTLGAAAFVDGLGQDFTISSDGCVGKTLDPGASCQVVVQFTPDIASAGQEEVDAQMEVSDGGTANGFLTVFGVPLTPDNNLTFTPSFTTFPDTAVGATSAEQVFILTDNSPSVATNLQLSAGSDFTIVAADTTCGASLNPGASCNVAVEFTPTTTGNVLDALTASNSNGIDDGVAALLGNATAP